MTGFVVCYAVLVAVYIADVWLTYTRTRKELQAQRAKLAQLAQDSDRRFQILRKLEQDYDDFVSGRVTK